MPVPAPDVAIPGPADGAGTTIKAPKGLSGRRYMSFGEKPDSGSAPTPFGDQPNTTFFGRTSGTVMTSEPGVPRARR